MLNDVIHLVRKEVLLEWRQKYALGGIVLYVFSTTFVIYISLVQTNTQTDLEKQIWNILFWITVLFTGVNAVAKSFTQEPHERHLYYYTLVSPQAVILSKMIYNGGMMILLNAICVLLFNLLIGTAVAQWYVFALIAFGGSLGFSFILSMVSAIASKAGNNATLMAILSFPVILPMILLMLKASKFAFIAEASVSDATPMLFAVFTLDVLVMVLSFVLFPYLWRD